MEILFRQDLSTVAQELRCDKQDLEDYFLSRSPAWPHIAVLKSDGGMRAT